MRNRNRMKCAVKISNLVIFLISVCLSGPIIQAQTVTIRSDTAKVTVKEKGSQKTLSDQDQNKNQKQQGNVTGQQEGNQNKAQGKVIKQVRGARPDMSKAKGARPNITRPSGSGIPKGAGKPGGVGRMKGR